MKKNMYKVVFYFSAVEKIVFDFAEGYDEKSALERVMRRYGSDVHFPQVKLYREM